MGSGKNSTFAADDILPVVVRSGDTVVVANANDGGTTINYLSGGYNGGVTGTDCSEREHVFDDPWHALSDVRGPCEPDDLRRPVLMAANVNIGSTASPQPADSSMQLEIPAGQTVTVKVVAGGTLSYFNGLNGLNAAASGTITNGSTQTFTTPAWLQPAVSSQSSLQITGGNY